MHGRGQKYFQIFVEKLESKKETTWKEDLHEEDENIEVHLHDIWCRLDSPGSDQGLIPVFMITASNSELNK
jgi:hypothetical protein